MTPTIPATTVLGLDLLAWAALALALLGVVGSVAPLLPGAALGLAGLYLYWWASGYTEPGVVVLVVLTALGLLAVAVDWLAGALSATVGGASFRTTVLAGVAAFLLFFVAGPVGILLGVAGVVFLAELRRTEDPRRSLRTAAYTTVGMLASTVAQALLTATLFVALLAVAFL